MEPEPEWRSAGLKFCTEVHASKYEFILSFRNLLYKPLNYRTRELGIQTCKMIWGWLILLDRGRLISRWEAGGGGHKKRRSIGAPFIL
ncbi:hypothetical protein D770_25185 [Flammeovirgaceae bacterium 311]|nr:hypothetical protein D770_25185 [Flammeovirgaceae bacterium 311]